MKEPDMRQGETTAEPPTVSPQQTLHGPQGSVVQFHSVTLGCTEHAANAGFGAPQSLLSPKSHQAPWEIVPASVVIRGVGKALRRGHVRVRPNARSMQPLDLSSVILRSH